MADVVFVAHSFQLIREVSCDRLVCEVVEYVRSKKVKDQIELSGNDIVAVSMIAARLQQSTNIRHKDLRKFLDGIYVSEKGPTPIEG